MGFPLFERVARYYPHQINIKKCADPYLTLPSGWMRARQTPSTEATARAQCASLTDLNVDRTSLKL